MADHATPAATATSTTADAQRNGPAMPAIKPVGAAPPTTASNAYRPSAVATPSAPAPPTAGDVRAVNVTRYVATAPTGMAIPQPASSPATSDSVTGWSHGYRSWSRRASRRPAMSTGHVTFEAGAGRRLPP